MSTLHPLYLPRPSYLPVPAMQSSCPAYLANCSQKYGISPDQQSRAATAQSSLPPLLNRMCDMGGLDVHKIDSTARLSTVHGVLMRSSGRGDIERVTGEPGARTRKRGGVTR